MDQNDLNQNNLSPQELRELEKRLFLAVRDGNGTRVYINGKLLIQYILMTCSAIFFLLSVNRQWIDIYRRVYDSSMYSLLPLESGLATTLWLFSTIAGSITVARLFCRGNYIIGTLYFAALSFFGPVMMYFFPITAAAFLIRFVYYLFRSRSVLQNDSDEQPGENG